MEDTISSSHTINPWLIENSIGNKKSNFKPNSFHFIYKCRAMSYLLNAKQGYTLKTWLEGVSDEAYYPWESPKKFKIGQPSICQRTKEAFNSWLNGNLGVFQNHRKQAKFNIIFHSFPSLGLNEPPDGFEFFKSVNFYPINSLT